MRTTALTVLTAVALLLVQCGGSACDLDPYLERVSSALDDWDAAVETARVAPSEILAEPIANLQGIRNAVAGHPPPSCAIKANASLIAYMDHTIRGFTATEELKPQAEIAEHFSKAETALADYHENLESIRKQSLPEEQHQRSPAPL